jgi:hypothetical protein
MPVARGILVLALAMAACTAGAWIVVGRSHANRQVTWKTDAIRATLEVVVPAHNDASFRYVLENRTDTDYRIADGASVRMAVRSRSTRELTPRLAEHVSGEFPLWVPARRRVHFALVWTSDHEIGPDRLGDFVAGLDVQSFVLLDDASRYQIEFPASH